MLSDEAFMLNQHLDIPYDAIVAFCEKYRVRRLSLFGSVLRDDFGPDSDVDVLVEFEPDAIPGWEFVGMQTELSELLGRTVDLNTPGFLSKSFRDRVIQTAQVLYERS